MSRQTYVVDDAHAAVVGWATRERPEGRPVMTTQAEAYVQLVVPTIPIEGWPREFNSLV